MASCGDFVSPGRNLRSQLSEVLELQEVWQTGMRVQRRRYTLPLEKTRKSANQSCYGRWRTPEERGFAYFTFISRRSTFHLVSPKY
jgi:hypothetical protein